MAVSAQLRFVAGAILVGLLLLAGVCLAAVSCALELAWLAWLGFALVFGAGVLTGTMIRRRDEDEKRTHYRLDIRQRNTLH